jgi:hypothetical protein
MRVDNSRQPSAKKLSIYLRSSRELKEITKAGAR